MALPHYDETMSFSETIFLFVLALVIFGPKKLPEIARQAGRLLAELRRASNEFKSQIETEIAHLEVEKKQTILPPSAPPQGAVASLSLNPASTRSASAGIERNSSSSRRCDSRRRYADFEFSRGECSSREFGSSSSYAADCRLRDRDSFYHAGFACLKT